MILIYTRIIFYQLNDYNNNNVDHDDDDDDDKIWGVCASVRVSQEIFLSTELIM